MTPEQLAVLQSYGLSEYASRAYVALLTLGRADARETARTARIPLGKIYLVLDQLADKGLVRVHPVSPKEYTPVLFQEWLDHLRSVHEDRIRDLAAKRSEHGALFPVGSSASSDDRGRVRLVRGRRNVIEKLRAHARASKRDILFLASDNMIARSRNLVMIWEEACLRGIRPRALALPAEGEALKRLCELGDMRDKRALRPPAAGNVEIAIFDGERAMIIQLVPDDESLTQGEDVAVLTELPAMVETLQALLEPIWTNAPEL